MSESTLSESALSESAIQTTKPTDPIDAHVAPTPSADAVSPKHDLIKGIVLYEGQEFEVPPQVGASDTLLREALRPLGVNLDSATFSRDTERTDVGNVLRIRITKNYATKGATRATRDALDAAHPFAPLVHARPFVTPAYAVEHRLRALEADGALDYVTLITAKAEIENAIKQSEHEASEARQFVQSLLHAPAVPMPCILEGF